MNAPERLSSCAYFNPRVLAGGRDCQFPLQEAGNPAFQSPRPRVMTRPDMFRDVVFVGVSIPASSRDDATHCRRWKLPRNGFNPCVLAGGRDTLSGLSFCRGSCFNPRALAISQSRNNGLLAASGRGAESQNNGENLPGGDRNQRFAVGARQEEASQCKKNAHAFFHLNATPKEH